MDYICPFAETVFCESLAHAQNKYELLKESFRTSKQGGKIVIADCFSYTDEYDEKEKEYFKHFQEGMAVPSIIKYETFEPWMKEIGFKNIKGTDLTKNMIQSAVFASEHAQMRIDREPEASSEITLGRLAMIGIEKLSTEQQGRGSKGKELLRSSGFSARRFAARKPMSCVRSRPPLASLVSAFRLPTVLF